MAIVTQGVVVLANGFDLSCYLKSVDAGAGVDMHDATALCDTSARRFQPGLVERSVSGEGFFAFNGSDDTLSIDKQFSDALSASANQIITIGEEGSDLGDLAVMMNTKQASYNVQETVGDLIMTNFEAKATKTDTAVAYQRGNWLFNQSISATTNGAALDTTIVSWTGWLAHVHIIDADGDILVRIQHSTDGSTWVDFDARTVAPGGYQYFDAGETINRYVRARIELDTATVATVAVALKLGFTG